MKYRIEVSKTIVRKTIVEVDAPDDDTAKAAGLQRARANGGMDMVWLTPTFPTYDTSIQQKE
jgi:hypothetical protein